MFNLWKTWSVTEYRAFSFVWEMNFKRPFPFAHITPYHMQNLLSPWQILLGRKWSSAGGETPGVLSETSLRDAWRKTLRYVWQTALLLIYTSPLSSPLLPAHVIPFMCDFRVDDNLEYWKILEISAVLLTGSWICYFPSCNLGLAEQFWISSECSWGELGTVLAAGLNGMMLFAGWHSLSKKCPHIALVPETPELIQKCFICMPHSLYLWRFDASPFPAETQEWENTAFTNHTAITYTSALRYFFHSSIIFFTFSNTRKVTINYKYIYIHIHNTYTYIYFSKWQWIYITVDTSEIFLNSKSNYIQRFISSLWIKKIQVVYTEAK